MTHHRLKKADFYIAGWGAVICLGIWAIDGTGLLGGALVGALVASLNWVALRYVGVRLAASGENGRFGVFMGLKTLLLLVGVCLVALYLPVDLLGFILGFASLVLGVVTFSFRLALADGEAALGEDV